ncbi:radical SAM family heme chaperone HemW [Marichromatium sp. AB31]|uniref:radical SAM family heme chaperone HemW n=1 Tax=Marichromatium sp. AB31 TaxID=2483362 RepID=UPI000F3C991B|nr:radical SAM family heme chaperone HemW [Marichromatium sp. AB31]RNE89079.1 radical SAM family heme chaperone HemW [Marichromatium sp. AB31]
MTGHAAGAGGGAPPLGLYIHLPWCVRKCPYCDFNSHPVAGAALAAYVEHLLADLDRALAVPEARRPVVSIFIGGGTPSLLPGSAVARLLDGVRARLTLAPDAEISLEANPGTAEARRFAAYREAGVNRLSIGVQSLEAERLVALGRIHSPEEARAAVTMARAAGFDNLNLDLMFGLPGQTPSLARDDLEAALALAPEHLSYYQLSLEPGSAFHDDPPPLPDPDLVADIAAAGQERLAAAGLARYEVSAYARAGRRCRHNLNYWRFGDYLGIGAGAHAKLSRWRDGRVERVWREARLADPEAYLGAAPEALIAERRVLDADDLIVEFALNALRLVEGFAPADFVRATGLPVTRLAAPLERARALGLIEPDPARVVPSARGRDFLDDLVGLFVPGDD